MSIDITFEELEKTAFEFAKSLAVGNVQTGFSIAAMERAKKWHEEAELRKSWYVRENISANDWLNIDIDSDYDESDFQREIDYWVIRGEDKPFKVNLVRFESIRGRYQPIFSHPGSPSENFTIDKFLKQSISGQLTSETRPRHLTESKTSGTPTSSSLRMGL